MDFFDRLLSPSTLVLIVGGGIAATAIIAHYLNDWAKKHSDNELKTRMLEEGRSVEDIERVLEAGGTRGDGKNGRPGGASEAT